MSKQSIETIIGKDIPQKDFEILEFVNMWHPSAVRADGKSQVITLYLIGGMRLIRDMLPTARKAERLHNKAARAQAEYEAFVSGVQ